jgi:hypothetical protein
MRANALVSQQASQLAACRTGCIAACKQAEKMPLKRDKSAQQ